ncbi:MAG: DsbA family oxidoreductase [Pelagibacteraceae bacterium]|nr:DsbA family oxidoreductase [Pelagibacteraceae bacterium]
MNKTITVDIYSDNICPWCYIGYVKFYQAINHFKDYDFNVIWRPFQLNPDMSVQGIKRDFYLKSKFGTIKNADSIYKRIENEGRLINIYFQFNKIKIIPNSFLSHKLLAYAFKKKKQPQVLELLFYQYFIEGSDLSNLDALIQISKQTNIHDEKIKNYLISNQDNENLIREQEQAKNMGIKGVPCFIFNKEFVVSGAQTKETFIKIIHSLSPYE